MSRKSWANFGTSIGLGSGLVLTTIRDPLLTLKNENSLVSQLVTVVSDSYGKGIKPKEVRKYALEEQDRLFVVADTEGKAVAFTTVHTFGVTQPKDGLYFTETSVLKRWQRKGLGKALIGRAIQHFCPLTIAGITQNPIAYLTVSGLTKRLYPKIDGSAVPVEVRILATNLMYNTGVRENFNPKTCVLNGWHNTFPYQIPVSCNVNVDKFFLERLQISNDGSRNAVLFVGYV